MVRKNFFKFLLLVVFIPSLIVGCQPTSTTNKDDHKEVVQNTENTNDTNDKKDTTPSAKDELEDAPWEDFYTKKEGMSYSSKLDDKTTLYPLHLYDENIMMMYEKVPSSDEPTLKNRVGFGLYDIETKKYTPLVRFDDKGVSVIGYNKDYILFATGSLGIRDFMSHDPTEIFLYDMKTNQSTLVMKDIEEYQLNYPEVGFEEGTIVFTIGEQNPEDQMVYNKVYQYDINRKELKKEEVDHLIFMVPHWQNNEIGYWVGTIGDWRIQNKNTGEETILHWTEDEHKNQRYHVAGNGGAVVYYQQEGLTGDTTDAFYDLIHDKVLFSAALGDLGYIKLTQTALVSSRPLAVLDFKNEKKMVIEEKDNYDAYESKAVISSTLTDNFIVLKDKIDQETVTFDYYRKK